MTPAHAVLRSNEGWRGLLPVLAIALGACGLIGVGLWGWSRTGWRMDAYRYWIAIALFAFIALPLLHAAAKVIASLRRFGTLPIVALDAFVVGRSTRLRIALPHGLAPGAQYRLRAVAEALGGTRHQPEARELTRIEVGGRLPGARTLELALSLPADAPPSRGGRDSVAWRLELVIAAEGDDLVRNYHVEVAPQGDAPPRPA